MIPKKNILQINYDVKHTPAVEFLARKRKSKEQLKRAIKHKIPVLKSDGIL